jgi:serine/threonine protein kinase
VGKFNEEAARFYIAEVILAVEHMHSKGVIHRFKNAFFIVFLLFKEI